MQGDNFLPKEKHLYFVTCGSGGHIFPAVSLAERMQQIAPDIILHLIIDKRGIKYLTEKQMTFFQSVDILSVERASGVVKYFRDLLHALLSMFRIIHNNSNSAVISFGSYLGFLSLCVAIVKFIPSYFYYSDAILGRFPKLSAVICSHFLYNFEQLSLYSFLRKKSSCVGYLLNRRFVEYLHARDLHGYPDFYKINSSIDRINILIVGGSQGSKFLTSIVKDAIASLPRDLKDKIFIFHQARKEEIRDLLYFYIKNDIKCDVSDFFHDILDIMTKSHLCISRGGASVISELTVIGVPSIIIPLSTAKCNHQFFNAKYLKEQDACILFEEKDLSSAKLAATINICLDNSNILSDMHSRLMGCQIKDGCLETGQIIYSALQY